jgi:hypothetical protein
MSELSPELDSTGGENKKNERSNQKGKKKKMKKKTIKKGMKYLIEGLKPSKFKIRGPILHINENKRIE